MLQLIIVGVFIGCGWFMAGPFGAMGGLVLGAIIAGGGK